MKYFLIFCLLFLSCGTKDVEGPCVLEPSYYLVQKKIIWTNCKISAEETERIESKKDEWNLKYIEPLDCYPPLQTINWQDKYSDGKETCFYKCVDEMMISTNWFSIERGCDIFCLDANLNVVTENCYMKTMLNGTQWLK